MVTGRLLEEDRDIRAVLEQTRTIAIVGLSPKPERDSYRVARYLMEQGYKIIPVRPARKEILGERVYASLDQVNGSIDIVDVFRSPAQVLEHAHAALQLRYPPRAFWMQLNIENREAADLLMAAGIDVVMNRCIKIDHVRLLR
jgi:predicted CoA-binding protein